MPCCAVFECPSRSGGKRGPRKKKSPEENCAGSPEGQKLPKSSPARVVAKRRRKPASPKRSQRGFVSVPVIDDAGTVLSGKDVRLVAKISMFAVCNIMRSIQGT
jgi:hypothetical protein